MSGASIMAEVAAALREASAETGDGTPLMATLRRKTAGPATPWDTDAEAFTDYSVAVLVGYYRSALIDGDNIRMGDRKVMMEAGSVTPTTEDRIIIGGSDYAIVSIMPASPGGADLYYTLQCRM